ncbi:putative fatty acid 2-hydroxylase 1-like isoform X1 [Sesbania bispinosa]|nr:putative fatty acid 2-hydroxylase 1-like isoform X1 [Sesbania bispinosa]
MVAQNFVVDLNKPLVFQVGHLEEAYEEWVHQPIVSKEGPRFFQNNVLEFWNLVKLISTPSTAPALFGGGLLGYVIYDCTHYYLHHGQPKTEVPRNLKPPELWGAKHDNMMVKEFGSSFIFIGKSDSVKDLNHL